MSENVLKYKKKSIYNMSSILFSFLDFFFRPKHGGKYCVGQRKRYRSCNIEVFVKNQWLYGELHKDNNVKI